MVTRVEARSAGIVTAAGVERRVFLRYGMAVDLVTDVLAGNYLSFLAY